MPAKLKNITLVVMTFAFLCGFMLWSVLKPDDVESASERRPLATFPSLNAETVLSGSFMTDFEKYTLDQFPLRDQFRTVKAVTSLYLLRQKDNNEIFIKDGFAAKLEYPLNTDSTKYAASRFQFIYDRYLSGKKGNIYFAIIPDKNYFMAKENGYLTIDYEALAANMKEQMDYADYIDLFQLLELPDYYTTDTHWRQEKITGTAQQLAAEMGVNLQAEYTAVSVEEPFYGVYYGQSALPLPPDQLYYLDNAILRDCKVYDYETDAIIPVYDLEKAKGKDPYEMFLSGPKSLLTIENPKANTNKELILFRDSFGSSIAPLLAEGYAKITLVDIRYISPNLLGKFISFSGQDVLFLYSTSVLNNSITMK